MAEEEEEEEGPDDSDDSQESEHVDEDGPLKILIVLVIILILLGGIGYTAYILLLSPKQVRDDLLVAEDEQEFMDEYKKRMQRELVFVKDPVYTEKYEYTVNLKEGRNILKLIWIGLLDNEKDVAYLNKIKPEIDDKMISLLKGLTYNELQTRFGIQLLKLNILRKINNVFKQEYIELSPNKDRSPIKKVLIVEYYIQ